ncbi:glycosyltransferase family 2 protein [Arenicellales bacterium IMCC55707]
MNSKVSVLMPVYNQESTVVAAINSVLGQTYSNFELVIGDDCSTDRTYALVKDIVSRNVGRVKMFKNRTNLGITENCNKILNICEGDLIVFTAGDDLLYPQKLEKQVALMSSTANTILSYHDVEIYSIESKKTIRYQHQGRWSCSPRSGPTSFLARELTLWGTEFMHGLSVMVRREAIPKTGYDFRVKTSSDWLMLVEICAGNRGMVAYIPEPLARYQRSTNSARSFYEQGYNETIQTLQIISEKYPVLADAVEKHRAGLLLISAARKLTRKNYRSALIDLGKGLKKGLTSPEYLIKGGRLYFSRLFTGFYKNRGFERTS